MDNWKIYLLVFIFGIILLKGVVEFILVRFALSGPGGSDALKAAQKEAIEELDYHPA